MDATIQVRAEYKTLLKDDATKHGIYIVEIVDSEEATEDVTALDISPEGATITYEADQENVFTPVVPSSCSFTLYAITDTHVTKLKKIAKSDAGRYSVRVR